MVSSIIVRLLDMGSSWISTYWGVAWNIGNRMGARLVDLGGDLLGVFSLVPWDLHLFSRYGALIPSDLIERVSERV